jgi:hypothetical protein
VLFLGVALVASPAAAADIKRPLILYGLGNSADFASTEYALGRGGHEVNPLMRERGGRLAVKLAHTSAATAFDVWLQKKHHKAVKPVRIAVCSLLAGMTAWNVYQGAKAR